jgi:hypothetical protein
MHRHDISITALTALSSTMPGIRISEKACGRMKAAKVNAMKAGYSKMRAGLESTSASGAAVSPIKRTK